MSETLLVMRREFLERVRSRAYLLGTLLLPAFLAGILVLPTLFDQGEERSLVVVDEAPPGVAARFVALLGAAAADGEGNRYRLETVPGPLAGVRAGLQERLRREEIDGFVVLPADVLESSRISYRAPAVASPGMVRELGAAASEAVQAERLRRAGLDVREVAALVARVEVDNARITAEGEERGDAVSTLIVAYVLAFAAYLMVTLYGVAVMRSVLEEKTSRIVEVLVSSLRTTHLMAGKILGVAAAAFLQVLLWVGALALLGAQSERIGLPAEAARALAVEPGTAALLLVYFLLGFLLFAAMFAALGAAMTSEQETQSLQMLLVVPLFLPLLFLVQLTSEPTGTVSTVLGLLPFTAPIAMPIRMASAPIPAAEVVASLTLLLAALALVSWLAGKIYRIGILATGRRPTLRELGRWLRTA